MELTRRDFCLTGGALIVSFALVPRLLESAASPQLPGSLGRNPYLDSWIRIDAAGKVTVFTGKAELGQGIKTAIAQIAAEELGVAPAAIQLITADTALTANEGYTAGSHSVQDSGTAVRNAAAQVREILIAAAAKRWHLDASQVRAQQGAVVALDGRSLGYGQLVADESLHVQAQPQSKLKASKDFAWIGKAVQRLDIPAKVTGGPAYVQDMRLPGMVHARVVRPPSFGAKLAGVDLSQAESMPGVIKALQDGDFLAVVAEQEFQAVQAMQRLASSATWVENASLPSQAGLPSYLMALPAEDAVVIDQPRGSDTAVSPGERILEATFTRAYQCHASMGPSCAVAQLEGDSMTVWNHSQGVFPNRGALAELLAMPAEKIRGIHTEGAGCYGHNGADDVAADAALIARALPGVPVRVQWMREQEHVWEPFGPAMVSKVRATLDAQGSVTEWRYELWSNTHSTRPGPAASLLPARLVAHPFPPRPARVEITPEGSGDRNSIPLYDFPGKHVIWHFLKDMPLRVSALRSLGAYMNVFSIESFMDELAQTAGIDPVAFRLKHLKDPRAQDVVRLAAQKFGWAAQHAMPRNRGRGFAFARYKNLAAYCAVACEVSVEHESGTIRLVRAVAAVDSGEIVNPDGVRNQTEGGILQSISWTLYEAVKFNDRRVISTDWSTYPILRFASIPDSVEVHLIPRPGEAFLGAGEAAQGPAAAALANAAAGALGFRLRDIPFTPDRVRAALNRSA
jgi:nicotinate dehydrogenase subunit B